MKQKIKFLKAALKDYKVGAVARTSKFAIKKIVNLIGPEKKYFIEFGAGDGVITIELLNKIPADGKLIAIELNKDLLLNLRKIKDERLTVVEGDVVEWSKRLYKLGLPRIDCLISSVPFSFFSPKTREQVINNAFDALLDKGEIILSQSSPLMAKTLRKIFGDVETIIELRNIPPCFIMRSSKK